MENALGLNQLNATIYGVLHLYKTMLAESHTPSYQRQIKKK